MIANAATFGNIIVATGSFVLLLLLLKKFAWKNITEILEKRAKKISTDIDEAEKANSKAHDLLKKRQEQLTDSKKEGAEIISAAKESAGISRQNILQDAQAEVTRLKEKANSDILQEKESALASIRNEVADLTLQLTTKILKREIDSATHKKLVDEYINKLGE